LISRNTKKGIIAKVAITLIDAIPIKLFAPISEMISAAVRTLGSPPR
jgi:hypothetical protein